MQNTKVARICTFDGPFPRPGGGCAAKIIVLALAILALLVMSATASAQTTYNSTSMYVNTGDPRAGIFSFADDPTPYVQVQIRCELSPVWWYYTGRYPDYHAYGPFTLTGCSISYTHNPDGSTTTAVTVPAQSPIEAGGQTITLEPSYYQSTGLGRYMKASGTSAITVQ